MKTLIGSLLAAFFIASGAQAQVYPSPRFNAPTAVTPSITDNSTRLVTSAFVWETMAYKNAVMEGADPTGVADSAPYIQAAAASNTFLVIPPGTYRLKSTQTSPCCAFNPSAVLVQNLSNFVISAYGATFVVDDSITIAGTPPAAFHFDKDSNFKVMGLTVQGNRTGLNSGDENTAFDLSSLVNFKFEDIHATGNFGGNGSIFAGDWLVNGEFDNITGDTVGQCYDVAFVQHVRIGRTRAIGVDYTGSSASGHIGSKCVSVIYDGPNSATNNTGISFTETTDLTVGGVDASNFATGAYVTTGSMLFVGNNWHDNPGAGSAAGLGVFINYVNGGSFSSVGRPPKNITILDRISGNGAVIAGSGVTIAANAISNGDAISGITIGGQIDDANHGVSSDTSDAAKLNGVLVFSNFANAGLDANMAALASFYSKDGAGVHGSLAVAQTMSAAAAKMPSDTLANAGTCDTAARGSIRTVSDSSTNTWGATITGSGSDVVSAFCNGTNWTVLGK